MMPAREDERELDALSPEDWRKPEVLCERVNTKSMTVARKYERGQMWGSEQAQLED